MRAELGYSEDERVCIVNAGGSGVGQHLLRRVIEAHPIAAERVPELRTIAVAGPRITPEELRHSDGVEVVGYVRDLHRHWAVCDVAVVDGLATTMELTTARRPFLYFPLKHQFEQQLHVRHRLERLPGGPLHGYRHFTIRVIPNTSCCDVKPPPGATTGEDDRGLGLAN